MKRTTIESAVEQLTELKELLQERIEDLQGEKGHSQTRHAFTYYRAYVEVAIDDIAKADFPEVFKGLEKLTRLFDDRVSDLHEWKGAQHYRQLFVYYRSKVYAAWFPLRDEFEAKKK
jgi:hypothetical protein